MSKENLEKTLGKLLNDFGWRDNFFKNQDKALTGIDLTNGEKKVLKSLKKDQLEKFNKEIGASLGMKPADVTAGHWNDRTTD